MRKILCVVGDKGGCGKSTWARGFADLCRTTGVRAGLFDGDWVTRSLFKPFCGRDADGAPLPLARQDPRGGCVLYDVRHRQLGRDLLLNSMAIPETDVILHDLPAGFRGDFARVMGIDEPDRALQDFVLSARDLGLQPVFVTVMTPNWAGHQTAAWLAEAVRSLAPVVAVRNLAHGDEQFALWRSGDQPRFAKAGGIEIAMPALDPVTYLNVDSLGLRASAAERADTLSVADRMRLSAWRRRFEAEVTGLADLFGLKAPKAGLPARTDPPGPGRKAAA